MKDEKDKEKVQAENNSTVGNSKYENELDAKFDAMAKEQRQNNQGN